MSKNKALGGASPFYGWLLANKDEVLSGGAEYEGETIKEDTVVYQHKNVVSFILATQTNTTPYRPRTAANNYLKFEGLKHGLISGLFGWWGFPFGPLLTTQALMTSSQKRTVASLLQMLEHGWDAPANASYSEQAKRVVDLTDAAVEEINSRRESGSFSSDLGVRFQPVGKSGRKVQVAFDYPVSDGQDWISECKGLAVLIDKNDETYFAGRLVDFNEGVFCIT